MWSMSSQPTRLFGWTAILARWNEGVCPLAVSTVLDNLGRRQSPPASHFFTYLNEEQDGLKWFIYECVASSWMWETGPRLTYIKEALDLLEMVDSTFPSFPGSPGSSVTVRAFLEGNLTSDQLAYIEMMPRLATLNTSTRAYEVDRQPLPGVIKFHIIRNRAGDGADDDLVVIKKTGDDKFSYHYTDPLTNSANGRSRFKHTDLSANEVISMLSNLLKLLALDDMPYQCIQVTLPTTPTVLVKISDLCSSTRDLIYDSVEMVLNSWPTRF